jgi:RNA polymerase sigma-70 factor (ECF subfamily)
MIESVEFLTSPTLLEKICTYDTGVGYRDQVAWQRFIDKYQPLLVQWCRGMGLQPADVEDVTSQVLVTLARKMKEFVYDSDGSFRSWLGKIFRNELQHHWRKRQRRPGDWGAGGDLNRDLLAKIEAACDQLAESLAPVVESDKQLATQAVELLKATTDPRHWEAFRLTTIEEQKGANVARQLDMSIDCVYQIKHRTIKKLRSIIARLQANQPSE